MAVLIALILTISMSGSIVLLPTVNAHTPPWTIISYAYIVAAPNPIGIDQTASVTMWIDTPLPSSAIGNDILRHDYTLTITAPDGKTETKHWDVVTDTTAIQFCSFVPDQIGNYTLKFDYGGQNYTWSGAYKGDIFTSASKTTTLVVQQEQIPAATDSFPLPAEYWTRPIEGQNTYWFSVSSNWLGSPYVPGANPSYGVPGAFQPDGPAPNSAHVMWSKPIQYGGVLGGNQSGVIGGIPGEMFYEGGSYNVRFTNPIIMYGTLYYQEPYGNSGTGGDYVAVDLRTGKELWRINASATGISLVPSFGYNYALESPNQHGFLPNGLLIAPYTRSGVTYWAAYDPSNGRLTTMNITNVPGGVNKAGPNGEYLKVILTNIGNATNPSWQLMEWNSSRVFGGDAGMGSSGWYSGTVNASLPSRYDWNVSVTLGLGSWSIGTAGQGAVPLVDLGNIALLIQGSFGGHVGDFGATVTTDPANITAVSLKPDSMGRVLWTKTYPPAPGNNSRYLTAWDPSAGVFVFQDKETMVHWGYSLANGNYLWGPSALTNDFTTDYNFFGIQTEQLAYGKLYFTGYSGILYAYDARNGTLLWTYGNGGEGNSTASGLDTPWGRYPTFISTIADGKVYLTTTEHSPNSPLYKDAEFRAINASDGTELWKIMQYANNMYGGPAAIADGYLVFYNGYDQQIYGLGKGPSAMTVTAPDVAASLGTSVVIRGSVIDISAGTTQSEQAARFPNGVPAVSDASQQEWMQYVYMQKPRPTDTKGVPVSIDVMDSSGTRKNIGTATSDADGMFSLTWTPDAEGSYTVIATFAGSESYWSSYAESSFAIGPAIKMPEIPQIVIPDYTMTIIDAAIAVIIAVAIVGALILVKRA
jgi:outer membrane protein assembly factor BamB